MLDDVAGLGGCLLCLVVVAIVAALILVPIFSDLGDSLADHERAKAVRIDAETRQEHTRSVDWQHEYQLWTTAIAAFTGGFTLKDVLLIGAVAGCALMGGLAYRMSRR